MAKKYEFQPDKPYSSWLNKLQLTKLHKHMTILLTPGTGKADLNDSPTLQRLLQAKES